MRRIKEIPILIKKFLCRNFLQLLLPSLLEQAPKPLQKSPAYLNWINSSVVEDTLEFIKQNGLSASGFIKGLNASFKTTRFELFLKRWLADYILATYNTLFDFYNSDENVPNKFSLLDNPLNRLTVSKFCLKFNADYNKIIWLPQHPLTARFLAVFIQGMRIIYISLKSGLSIFIQKKRFKIMREALWGLYDKGGYYFHDDFMVDGVKIKKEDLLFFSRDSMRWEKDRLRAYQDARKSGYAHFTLSALSIGLNPFLSRVIPKYVLSGAMLFLRQIKSQDFLLFQNLYWDFAFYALAYEKIFSHFSLISELGHNYFSSSHIAESIVCQNYGTEYYLMHWSDNSCNINRFINSFLGCDKYLLWGRAHFRGTEGNPEIMALTGLTFKKYIKQVATRRTQVLAEMNIEERGKIITFFDESFGGDCLMTELHYITFWETILRVAAQEKESTILIKPKDLSRYNHLPVGLKDRFLEIKKILEGTPNAYIIDAQRRSFIEAIGVSDIVVSQGMTSSSTIAIACGIEGFYLDEANYQHPFKDYFKDKIVFDNPDKLVKMIHETIYNKQSSLKNIPVCLLRKYDAFSDNFALERMRDILTGSRKKVGAIIQARMGSTRLPGKVMLKLGDKPILQHIVERLKLCQGIDEIVLAITVNSKDDILAELAVNNGIKFFRGDEEDVLARYFYAAKENKLDIIARVTSDCPFVDPYLVDDLAGCFAGYPAIDYISNTLKRTFPRGLDVEVFKFSALEKAFSSARLPYQREHVTPYIYEHRELFQLQNLENDCDLSGLRWTLDEKKDYEFIIEIYKRLYNKGRIFLTNDILMVLKEEPWLSDINSAVRQKAISK